MDFSSNGYQGRITHFRPNKDDEIPGWRLMCATNCSCNGQTIGGEQYKCFLRHPEERLRYIREMAKQVKQINTLSSNKNDSTETETQGAIDNMMQERNLINSSQITQVLPNQAVLPERPNSLSILPNYQRSPYRQVFTSTPLNETLDPSTPRRSSEPKVNNGSRSSNVSNQASYGWPSSQNQVDDPATFDRSFKLFPDKSNSAPSALSSLESFFSRDVPQPRTRSYSNPPVRLAETPLSEVNDLSPVGLYSHALQSQTSPNIPANRNSVDRTLLKSSTTSNQSSSDVRRVTSSVADGTASGITNPTNVPTYAGTNSNNTTLSAQTSGFDSSQQNMYYRDFDPSIFTSMTGGVATTHYSPLPPKIDYDVIPRANESDPVQGQGNRYQRKVKPKANDEMECNFCKSNMESPEVFKSHFLKRKIGRRIMVTCPILRKLVCNRCGVSGDNAHTLSHCPLVLEQTGGEPISVTNELKKTRHMASGKLRNQPLQY